MLWSQVPVSLELTTCPPNCHVNLVGTKYADMQPHTTPAAVRALLRSVQQRDRHAHSQKAFAVHALDAEVSYALSGKKIRKAVTRIRFWQSAPLVDLRFRSRCNCHSVQFLKRICSGENTGKLRNCSNESAFDVLNAFHQHRCKMLSKGCQKQFAIAPLPATGTKLDSCTCTAAAVKFVGLTRQ